jgi:hypothetical protein
METQTKLEEISKKWDSLTTEEKEQQTKAFLKQNPFIVNRDNGNIRTSEKSGFIVIELADTESFESNPMPKVHSFKDPDEANKKVEELYPSCTPEWKEVICKACVIEFEVTVGKRKKASQVPATDEEMVIENSHQHIRQLIQSHVDMLGRNSSNSKKTKIGFRKYSTLEEIKADYLQQVEESTTQLAIYIQKNHAVRDGKHRILSKAEKTESTSHSSNEIEPTLVEEVGLRVAPDPDFVDLIYSFFYPGEEPTIGEVIARSHYLIAMNYEGEDPHFRQSLTSKGRIGVTTVSDFKETVQMMTKYHFTTQPILDPNTGACVGSLNLERMVGLIHHESEFLPSTLNLKDLQQSGLLGPRPPMLDENASIALAEALFAKGCQAILFEHRPPLQPDPTGSQEGRATLEAGLHIMTPVDIVAYITE